MAIKIFKYVLKAATEQRVSMPDTADILAAQAQGNDLCIWAKVEIGDGHYPVMLPRTIEVFGTGETMPEFPRKYIGTTQMEGGKLVWHVFERLGKYD